MTDLPSPSRRIRSGWLASHHARLAGLDLEAVDVADVVERADRAVGAVARDDGHAGRGRVRAAQLVVEARVRLREQGVVDAVGTGTSVGSAEGWPGPIEGATIVGAGVIGEALGVGETRGEQAAATTMTARRIARGIGTTLVGEIPERIDA